MRKLSTSIAKTPAVWIPDNKAKNCYHCGVTFGMFTRKHHCRLCSRVHCNYCSLHNDTIPSFMQHLCTLKNKAELNASVRLCIPCHALISKSRTNKKFIYIAMGLPLLMQHVVQLRVLSRTWNDSIETLIGIYRGTQFLIGQRDYTNVERTFFRVHARELFGHNQWRRHLHVLNPNIQCNCVKSTCKEVMCRGGCKSHLTCEDIIFLYDQRQRSDIQIIITRFWKRLSVKRHLQMYFHWILFTKNADYYWNAIYDMCKRSLTLATVIFIVTAKADILDQIKHEWKISVLKSYRATRLFKRVSALAKDRAPLESIKQVLAQFAGEFPLPWDTDWLCTNVILEDTKVFCSATRPIQIAVVAKHVNSGEEDVKYLLIKYDDVVNDQVAMTIAYWLNCNCNVNISRYPVLRIDEEFGILEMVPDSKHLHEIKYGLKTSLINYILEHNINQTVKNVRQCLINTVAASSLFAYTMGVGDRHLRNMMITSKGIFFHIDFGYCFGMEPRGSNNAITLTQGIVEALGGTQSASYGSFVKQCKENYIIARRSADFFRRLATLALPMTGGIIRSHFTDRFIPGELDDHAVNHLELALNSASTWTLTSSVLELGYAVKCSAQEMFAFEF